jgi:hypothetical protein
MEKPVFFDQQDVSHEDLTSAIDLLASEVTERFGSFWYCGVVSGLAVTAPSGLRLTVAAGVAVTAAGERIVVASSQNVSFEADNAGASVVLRYLTGEPTDRLVHPVVGQLFAGRTADSYEIVVTASPDSTDIILTTIESIDSITLFATLSSSLRTEVGGKIGLGKVQTWMLANNAIDGTVARHLDLVGTGTVTTVNAHGQKPVDIGFRPDSTILDHMRLAHDHHLRSADPGSRSGTLSFSGTTVTARQIEEGDEFIVKGVRVTTISPNSIVVVPASLGGGFTVLLTQTGTLETKPLFNWQFSRVVTGVMPVDYDQTVPFPGTPTKLLAFTIVSGKRYLQWDSGPKVELEPQTDISDGNRFYTLIGGLERGALIVWVDYANLPGTNQSDYITIAGVPEDADRCLLGNVFTPQGGGTPMGYGLEGVGGNAYDTRPFGSVRYKHLDGGFKTLLARLTSEMRRDGWAVGGAQATSPGGFVFAADAGIVWIDGVRYVIANTAITLPANSYRYVYVNQAGTVVASATDPATDPTARFARMFFVKTGAVSGFTYVRDERNVLPDVDNAVKLGCDAMYSAAAQQKARIAIDAGVYGSARNLYRGRTLLAESTGPNGFDTVRIYLTHWSYNPFGLANQEVAQTCGIEIAVNCRWLPDDPSLPLDQQAVWMVGDPGHDASLWGLDGTGFYQQVKRREELSGRNLTWRDAEPVRQSFNELAVSPNALRSL